MIILGIDPGTASIGYGVIKKQKKNTLKYITHGLIKTNADLEIAERLKIIHKELNKLINIHQPQIIAVEKVFFFKNLKTIIPVSQAEGVILFTAAKKKILIKRFTPLQVKMALTKYGWAEKKQVQEKVKILLKLKKLLKSDDALDALAIALTYFLIDKK